MQENTIQRTFRFLTLIFIVASINHSFYFFNFEIDDYISFKHYLKYELLLFVFSFIVTLPFLVLKNHYRWYQIVLLPLWIYFWFEWTHLHLLHGYPNTATYFSILNTNTQESTEFIGDFLTFKVIYVGLFYILGLLLLHWFLKRKSLSHPVLFQKGYYIKVFLGISIFLLASYYDKLAPLTLKNLTVCEFVTSFNDYRKERTRYKEVANLKVAFSEFYRTSNHTEQEMHVVVIGESTSKHHMNIYGYPRENTPHLNQEKWFKFENALSPNAHTVPALEKALTFKNSKNVSLGMEQGSLIDLANYAGYETYWISNQAFSGEFETPISVIASKASQKIYTNAVGSKSKLDGELIAPYKKVIENKKAGKSKVIFIHLMGTHLSYTERYPNGFEWFSDSFNLSNIQLEPNQQRFVNQYDNAIAYNDYVVGLLLKELKKLNYPVTFSYFSDHGDEVYDFRNFHGHSDVLGSKYMYEIPFLFWCNDAYKSENQEKTSLLKSHLSSSFNIENLIHFYSDILDAYSSFYEPKYSPMSELFVAKDKNPNLKIIEHSTQNNIDFGNRIWCHRVNGIERMKEAKAHFDGFEIDLEYREEGWFEVNHPPQKSIGLSLGKVLNASQSKSVIWLDFKNLTPENSLQAATQLKNVIESKTSIDNILVESPCLNCLIPFDSLGFKTVYYLPFLHQMSEKELKETLLSIDKDLEQFKPSAISQERNGYPLLKKYFPYCDILSWDIKTEWTDVEKMKQTKKWVESEPRLKVFLVRFDSPNHR